MMAATIEFNKTEALAGLGLNESNYRLLDALVETEGDWIDFLKALDKEKGHQTFAVSVYREYKIDNDNYTFEEFRKDYMTNPINALQRLFWDDVIQEDVEVRLTDWMIRNNTTFQDLFKAHKKRPYKRLLYILN